MKRKLSINKENDEGDDEDEKDDKKKTESKWIHFCLGEHGILPWKINSKNSGFQMEWDVLTFCLAKPECKHNEDTTTHGYATIPYNVSIDDINCFMLFVNGLLRGESILCTENLSHHHLVSTNVNFLLVTKLFEFFQTNQNHSNWLKTILMAINSYKSAISCLSAYYITHKKLIGVPTTILYQSEFQLLFRLKMAVKHGLSNIIYNSQLLCKKEVSILLGIEEILLDFLNENIVIAGGAALYLGCNQWSHLKNRSDIDFFIMNCPQQKEIAQKFITLLRQTGRSIYKLGDSVITAISCHYVRRIQIILSTATNAQTLILDFDIPAVQTYYDGHCLHMTVGAQYSWLTKKCTSNINCKKINAIRLFGMFHKGFSLSKKAIDYLSKTSIGWPIKPEFQSIYEFAIPFLLPISDIPLEIQNANLYKNFKLQPIIEDQNETTILKEMKAMSSMKEWNEDYNDNCGNVFDGTCLQTYLNDSCELDDIETPYPKNNKMSFQKIISKYVFQISSCRIFALGGTTNQSDAEYEQKVLRKIYIEIYNQSLRKDINKISSKHFLDLKQKQVQPGKEKTFFADGLNLPSTRSIQASYSKRTTQFFENGFQQKCLPSNLNNINGKVLIYPAYIQLVQNHYSNMYEITVKWKCAQISWYL